MVQLTANFNKTWVLPVILVKTVSKEHNHQGVVLFLRQGSPKLNLIQQPNHLILKKKLCFKEESGTPY